MLQRLPLAAVGPMLMRRRSALRPTLALNFLAQALQGAFGTLDPRINFSRASSATRINAQGLVETVGSDVPRFQFDAVTLQPLGLLIEGQRTNLLTHSEAFENAAWAKIRSSMQAAAAVAPDGRATACKLVENTANDSHPILAFATVSTSSAHTYSVFAKAGERTRFQLSTNAGGAFCTFDIASGSVVSGSGGIASAGNGWWRCWITYTPTATSETVYVWPAVGTSNNYQGDGVSGFFVWGAQLELGTFPTSYIPTAGASATRAADVSDTTGGVPGYTVGSPLSVYVDFVPQSAADGNTTAFAISQAAARSSNRLSGRQNQTIVSAAGSTVVPSSPGPYTAGARTRRAYSLSATTVIAAQNGTVRTDSVPGIPASLDTLTLGRVEDASVFLNGTIRQFDLYAQALPAATLQTLTA